MKLFLGGLFVINIILSFCAFAWRITGNPLADTIPVFVDYIWMVAAGAVAIIALAIKIFRQHHAVEFSNNR